MTVLLHALAALVLGNFTFSFLLKRTHVISFQENFFVVPIRFTLTIATLTLIDDLI